MSHFFECTQPLCFFQTLPCSHPMLTSSSGKGLTRPWESSERYIWEFITLLWRLPVCRAESETQREEESEQRIWWRGFVVIILYTVPHGGASLSQQISFWAFVSVALCKLWINVALQLVMDYAIVWQSVCKSPPRDRVPWRNTSALSKSRIFHKLLRVADNFAALPSGKSCWTLGSHYKVGDANKIKNQG